LAKGNPDNNANPDKAAFCKIAAPLETGSYVGGLLPTKHS